MDTSANRTVAQLSLGKAASLLGSNLKEGGFVFVRVLGKTAEGKTLVSFAGNCFSVDSKLNLKAGDSFKAQIRTQNGTVLLVPQGGKTIGRAGGFSAHGATAASGNRAFETPSLQNALTLLGLANDALSHSIIQYITQSSRAFSKNVLLRVRKRAEAFTKSKKKAVDASLFLEEKSIFSTDAAVQKLLFLTDGEGSDASERDTHPEGAPNGDASPQHDSSARAVDAPPQHDSSAPAADASAYRDSRACAVDASAYHDSRACAVDASAYRDSPARAVDASPQHDSLAPVADALAYRDSSARAADASAYRDSPACAADASAYRDLPARAVDAFAYHASLAPAADASPQRDSLACAVDASAYRDSSAPAVDASLQHDLPACAVDASAYRDSPARAVDAPPRHDSPARAVDAPPRHDSPACTVDASHSADSSPSLLDAFYQNAASLSALPCGLLTVLNHMSTGDAHWIVLPYQKEIGAQLYRGSIRIKCNKTQGFPEKMYINAKNEQKSLFFEIFPPKNKLCPLHIRFATLPESVLTEQERLGALLKESFSIDKNRVFVEYVQSVSEDVFSSSAESIPFADTEA